MQSPAPGENKPLAAIQPGHSLAGEQLCQKGLGAQQAGHGPAVLQGQQAASWAVPPS